MSAFLNQRLTNAGWDALSIALGGGRLTFFKMQAGSGTIANDDAILGMTALVAPVCDIPITSYVIEGDGQITLFGNINSSELDVGFNFKELGVFATIEQPIGGKGGTPSGPNIQAIVQATSASPKSNPVVPPPAEGTALMYSYCNSYETSDYIPGKGETTDVTNTIQVTIKIAEAPDVVINITQGEQFAVVNIGPPNVGAGPWSYTQANVAYLKRLVQGPAMLITEDENTITIGQRQLTADLDLYVANGNPDISPDFSTIQNALNYLSQYLIPTTVQARIHVARGIYLTEPGKRIEVNHPNSQSITIQGPQNASLQGNSLSIAGSAYDWRVTYGGISNTSTVLVGDWVIVDAIGGVTSGNAALVSGFFEVMSKTATSITVRVLNSKASFGVAGSITSRLWPITAIVRCPLNSFGMYIGSYGIKLLQHIGFVTSFIPTITSAGVDIHGYGNFKRVGVHGWACNLNNYFMAIGINCAGGQVFIESCAASYNEYNLISTAGAAVRCAYCAFSYARQWGIWAEGGDIGFNKGWNTCGGNLSHGIVSGDGSNIVSSISPPGGGITSERNDGYGIWIVNRSSLVFTNQGYAVFQGNVGYDLVVQNFGLVSGSGNVMGSRIFNQGIGVMGPTGGLIA